MKNVTEIGFYDEPDGDGIFLEINTCDEVGTRVVTRAKYCISFLRPFQGMVPWKPMPMLRVAATMRVSSGVVIADGCV